NLRAEEGWIASVRYRLAQRFLEMFDRPDLFLVRHPRGLREDRVEPALQRVVEGRLVRNPRVAHGQFGPDRTLDPLKPLGVQNSRVEQFLAQLNQPDRRRMRAQADKIERAMALAGYRVTAARC